MKNFTTSLAILALALVRVTVAMAAPTTTCPESQCKLKSEIGQCFWRDRENQKETQLAQHFKYREKYKCTKHGKPGFCCPAEKVSGDANSKRECLTDETIDSEARHAQCDEGTHYGYCKRMENELFGQCESGHTAKVKCSAKDPCPSHNAAKCVDRLKCVECTENKDCRGRWTPMRPQCHDGVCVECFENKHCSGGYCEHGECGTQKMSCSGYTWPGDNGFSRGPGLVINFSDRTEAHFHLNKTPETRPRSVNYPYAAGKQVNSDDVRNHWMRIVEQCKKAVEHHATFKWAAFSTGNRDSFFNQKTVSAVFNGGKPTITSRAP